MNQRELGTPDSSGSAWYEERFCRINPAQFAVGPEVAEHVTARAMKEMRDGAEDFALGALARTGCAEQKPAAVLHALLGLS